MMKYDEVWGYTSALSTQVEHISINQAMHPIWLHIAPLQPGTFDCITSGCMEFAGANRVHGPQALFLVLEVHSKVGRLCNGKGPW